MNLKPLKILLLSPGGAGTHYNGAGTTFFRMYSSRHNQNMNLELLHGNPDQQGGDDFYKAQTMVSEIDGSFASKLRFIRAAKKWIKSNHQRFDVVHCTTGFLPGLQPAHFAFKLGLPTVTTIAGHRSDLGTNASLFSRLMRSPQKKWKMAAEINAMIATSSDIENELRDIGVPQSNIERIPYGVNIDRFSVPSPAEKKAIRLELGLDPDMPTVIFVGDSIKRKRPLLILESMSVLAKEGIEIQAAFVGPTTDADYLSQMKSYAQESQLDKNVHWFGMQTDVPRFLRAADVFILLSKGEGLPNAMLEAMACGLPAIGTRISGIKDLITQGETGFIESPDVPSVAKRLKTLVLAPEEIDMMGKAARARIESDYALSAVIEKYEKLFRKVSNGR